MNLDHDICYRALLARDPRFDGRFFTGVSSTGIYCRPVCPARTPKVSNCLFFACAAAAEEAGFRACIRCRPEAAPGTPAWRGTSATVSRALRLINEGALDDASVEQLAARLGVGDRHLRRLFAEHLGASPLAVAQTRRVHLAKQLISSSRLPMGQIAQAVGFHNPRRFNAAIRKSFARTPTQIRARTPQSSSAQGAGQVSLRLAYRPPLDWPALLAFLGPRLIPGVETIVGEAYRRTVSIDDFQGVIEVGPDGEGRHALRLSVPVEAASHLGQISGRLRRVFDLDADPEVIGGQLGQDPRLRKLVKRYPGIRIPGAWDPFEVAIRAILGQQVTVVGATRLAGRLVERFGRPLEQTTDDGAESLFPRAEILAKATESDIAAIGMPGSRARTILGMARAVAQGKGVLESEAGLEESVQMLRVLPGIGDWTARYIALRVLGEPDAFPAGDLGLRKALAVDGELPSESRMNARSERWRPWRAYAALLLWRELSDPEKGTG